MHWESEYQTSGKASDHQIIWLPDYESSQKINKNFKLVIYQFKVGYNPVTKI